MKSGQGIDTWEGTQVKSARPVIIKTAERDSLSGSAYLRLEHDARILGTLSGRVCPLLEVGQFESHLFIVMEKLAGTTLDQVLVQQSQWAYQRVLELAGQLLKTLTAVHEHGILHGDIKPANVLMNTTDEGTAFTLLGFGFSRSKRLDRSLLEQSADSIRYLSPEQTGVLKRDEGPHSDLFSLGAVLVECLTGRPLRQGRDPVAMLQGMLKPQSLELRNSVAGMPRTLEAIIEKLLKLDPGDRYQTASGALFDLEKLQRSLAQDEIDPIFALGTSDTRQTLIQPSLVGRERELRSLERALLESTKGARRLCLVEAPSGGGKSRLLDEFVSLAEDRGTWVLRGQATESSMAPFHAVTGIVRKVMARTQHEKAFALKLQQALTPYSGALTSAIPDIRGLLPHSIPGDNTLRESSENMVTTAVAKLFDSLSDPSSNVLVVIDDAQWLDEMSLSVLKVWHAANSFIETRSVPRITLVVAFRKNEVGSDHPLRTLDPDLTIDLRPLELHQIVQLVESMAGKLPAAVSELVLDLSEGNPFLACEVLTGLVESQVLVWTGDHWHLDEEALLRAQSSRKGAADLTKRLEKLSPPTLEVLSHGAILGRDFDLELVCALANLRVQEVVAQLELARRKQLIWSDANGERFRFIHDRIRESVLERLDQKDVSALHLRAALHIQQNQPDRFYDLAHHFFAAGQPETASPYALRAADDSYRRYALDLAEDYYSKALQATNLDIPARLTALGKLGGVRSCRGKYPEARESYTAALALTTGRLGRATLLGQLGEVSIKQGRMEQAASEIEQALLLLGTRIPTSKPGVVLGTVKQLGVQVLDALFKFRLPGSKREKRDLQTVHLCRSLTAAYYSIRPTINAFYVHLVQLHVARRYPNSKEYGAACSVHAMAMAQSASLRDSRGTVYAQKGLEIQRALGNETGIGEALWLYGLNLYSGAHYAWAIEKFRESLTPLERTGERWHLNVSANHIALCYYRLGDLEQAVRWAKRAYAAAMEIGDWHAPGISLMTLSLATGGAQGAEQLAAHVGSDRPTSVQTYNHLLIGHGAAALYRGETQRAISILESTWLSVQEAGIYNDYMSSVPAWLATAYRTAAMKSDSYDVGSRNRWLKKADGVLKAAERMVKKFPNELPHVLRERGLFHALEGRPKEAKASLRRSIVAAERTQARLEKATSMYHLAQLGKRLEWPGSSQDLEEAKSLLLELNAGFVLGQREVGIRPNPSLSLMERFDTVLEEGRKLASSLSRADLYSRIEKAATLLLRAEECLVFESVAEADFKRIGDEDEDSQTAWCQSLLRRAAVLGVPVVLSEEMDGHNDLHAVGEARSALCAPFFARGKLEGCFYVFHRRIDGLFGPEEKRLASFISAISGAALENADGFERLTELSRTLETRVEVRTAELAQTSERLAVTLRSIGDGVIVVDPTGTVRNLNHQAEKLLGLSEPEAKGRHVDDVYSLLDDHTEAVMETPFQSLSEVRAREGKLHTATGQEMAVSDTVAPIRSEEGALLGVVLAFRDLTRQREMEMARLRGEKLESLGVMAGGLAHDLNNLLTTIKGNLGLLEVDLGANEEYRDLIESGLEASNQAAELADRLITFSRGGDPVRRETDLGELLAQSAELACQGSEVHLKVSLADDLRTAEVDPDQLRQVFYNLVLNAVEASSDGGIVEVSAENEETSSQHEIKVRVSDQGQGIPGENLTKIFDPFFSTKQLGAGLGLTTSHSIVARHGGSIKVQTAPGEGSTFEVVLPTRPRPALLEHQIDDGKNIQHFRVA